MTILKDINSILAKLTKEQYEPYKQIYESMKEEYDKRYSEIFGAGRNRLYFENVINVNLSDVLFENRDNELYDVFYFIFEDLKTISNKYAFDNAKLDLLKNRIYEIKNNTFTGREYKLVKLLQLLINRKVKGIDDEDYELMQRKIKDYDDKYANKNFLIDYIESLPAQKITDYTMKFTVVISKDPYDIVGMSTDRRWVSCMTLPGDKKKPEGGEYHETLGNDITLGTLVAYLIEPNDKNIDKPYARIAIKPHYNQRDNTIALFAEDNIYNDSSLPTNVYDLFMQTVNTFLDEVQKDKNGIFVAYEELYHDSPITLKLLNKVDLNEVIDIDYMFNSTINDDSDYSIDINNKKYLLTITDANKKLKNRLVEVPDFYVSTNNYIDSSSSRAYDNLYALYIYLADRNESDSIVKADVIVSINEKVVTDFKTKHNNMKYKDYVGVEVENLYYDISYFKNNNLDIKRFIAEISHYIKSELNLDTQIIFNRDLI